MAHFLMHGLVVEAPHDLAAQQVDPTAADVRLVVDRGTVPEPTGAPVADSRRPGQPAGYVVTREGDAWTVTFGTLAAATCHPDRTDVRVVVDPAAPADLVTVLLSGPVMVVTALNRGHTVLHSSAVARRGERGALAVTGSPGSGKSTVARLLVGDDWQLLSDDALRVDLASPVLAHRGTTRSRLRSAASLSHDTATTASADGRVVPTDASAAPATAMLRAILCPVLSPDFTTPAIVALPRLAALMEVARSWSVGVVADADLLSRRLAWAGELVAEVPVLVLQVPWQPSSLDAPTDRTALREVVDRWYAADSPGPSR